ncbi:hypothetical protein BKA83DRAFT_4128443 [Pisolithus microcarpus]|nr:hypothetical protein BKA83DRAFT_4128443 [Pisolithus microcarpus]
MSTPTTSHSKSVQPDSPKKMSGQDNPESLSIGYSQFDIANLTALYNSTFAQFSNDERQAAARALLRHSAHLDGAHFQSRVKGGLHPTYTGFNPNMNDKKARSLSSKELVEASLQDVFNAVTMQDHLDRGITLLLHCAGVKSTSAQTVDEAFCQEFTLPHFQRFNKCCEVEIITPPEDSVQAGSISVDGPQYLPFPSLPTSSCIQCSAQDPRLFEAPTNTKVDCMPSAAIRQVKELAGKPSAPPSTPQKPHTIRSSRWEAKLRSSQWNLTYEQAVNLSQVLIADTQGSAGSVAATQALAGSETEPDY